MSSSFYELLYVFAFICDRAWADVTSVRKENAEKNIWNKEGRKLK